MVTAIKELNRVFGPFMGTVLALIMVALMAAARMVYVAVMYRRQQSQAADTLVSLADILPTKNVIDDYKKQELEKRHERQLDEMERLFQEMFDGNASVELRQAIRQCTSPRLCSDHSVGGLLIEVPGHKQIVYGFTTIATRRTFAVNNENLIIENLAEALILAEEQKGKKA